jgi:hypothetical protein
LIAHLTLVHDVAARIVAEIRARFPTLKLDAQEILFGAATHDIGKVAHPEELSGPGHLHEEAGRALLREAGHPDRQARFAVTHAATDVASLEMSDLIVIIADKWWKGRRSEDVELAVTDLIANEMNADRWTVLSFFDDLAETITADADARLEWQATFST